MFKLDAHKLLIALVMTAGVAACGGGGGGGDVGVGVGGGSAPVASSCGVIPASALASVDGLVAFMNQLIDNCTNDTSEPILLGDAILPADDTI